MDIEDLLEEQIAAERFVTKELATWLAKQGYTRKEVAICMGIDEQLLTAFARGFYSRAAYFESHITNKINPLTGKLFTDVNEYSKYRIEQKQKETQLLLNKSQSA